MIGWFTKRHFFILTIILGVFVFCTDYSYAQNESSLFRKSFIDADKTFSISVPKNWLTNQDGYIKSSFAFVNINGASINFVSLFPESERESRTTRQVDVEYAPVTEWFGLPSSLRGALSNDEYINNYIDQNFRFLIKYKVISANMKRVYGEDVYEIESESLHKGKLLYRDIERFVFRGDHIFVIRGAYLSSQPKYREIILATMNSFSINK